MRAALSYARLSQLATLLVGPAAAATLTPTAACTRGPCGPGNEVCADAAGNEAPISRFVFHLTDHRGCKINDPNGPVHPPPQRTLAACRPPCPRHGGRLTPHDINCLPDTIDR
eukprot:COSAG06_NODE_534_length_14525_cov_90.383058_12_plen_113_part_00